MTELSCNRYSCIFQGRQARRRALQPNPGGLICRQIRTGRDDSHCNVQVVKCISCLPPLASPNGAGCFRRQEGQHRSNLCPFAGSEDLPEGLCLWDGSVLPPVCSSALLAGLALQLASQGARGCSCHRNPRLLSIHLLLNLTKSPQSRSHQT